MKKRRKFTETVVTESDKQAVLSKSSLCRGMDKSDMQLLSPFFQCYSVEEGSSIYEEGDVEAFLCLIVSGEINIIKGDGKLISTLSAGGTVGEMTIIDDLPRSANAIALTEATVFAITRSSLNEIFTKSLHTWSNLMFNISINLSLRLRQTTELLSQYMTSADSSSLGASSSYPQSHPFMKKVSGSHSPQDVTP